jgi:DNA polymerase III alpha subunit (gram-positive type)
MTCPACKKSGVVRIRLQMGTTEVTMRSCSKCETRSWDRDGESIPLPGVLGLVPRRTVTV